VNHLVTNAHFIHKAAGTHFHHMHLHKRSQRQSLQLLPISFQGSRNPVSSHSCCQQIAGFAHAGARTSFLINVKSHVVEHSAAVRQHKPISADCLVTMVAVACSGLFFVGSTTGSQTMDLESMQVVISSKR
jgi:hypothetical protein